MTLYLTVIGDSSIAFSKLAFLASTPADVSIVARGIS